jgi:Glycosyltransferase family 87
VSPTRIRLAGVVLAFAAGVHVLFVASLFTGWLDPLFDDAMHRFGQGADFYAVPQAAHNIAEGVSVYARPKTLAVPYFYQYRYLPFTAETLGRLFLLLPPRAAYLVWVGAIELLLAADLWLTRRLFADPAHRRIALAAWLLYTPYWLELHMGQFSFVMATLSFAAIALWMRGRTLGGDALWTSSLLVKSNTAVFAPVLLKLRRWRAIAAAFAVVALVSAPYFATVPGSLVQFSRNYTRGLGVETLAGNQGFAALIASVWLRLSGRWGPDLAAMTEAVRWPLAAWTALVVGASLAITWRASARHATELFLLWLVAYFLVYKHVWEHHYVMLLPVFVLAFHSATRSDGVRVPRALLLATFAVCALPTAFVWIDRPGGFDPEWAWTTGEALLFHAPKPLAALALYAALAAAILRARGAPGEPTPRAAA